VSARILQVFNRYLFPGGEEKSVDRIFTHLSERHEMSRCFYESAEWKAPGAPGPLGQVRRLFSNPEGRARFENALAESHADVAMFHNIYPVGSPALYHAARDRRVPVIQYLHNFRPFSVGGALFVNGQVNKDSLHGSFTAEILAGVWQGSVLKTALFALMLKLLHRSGALSSVKAWIAISEFMRQRILEGGWMPPERIHTLRHSWDAMCTPPPVEGEGPEEALVREKARQNPYIVFLGQIGGSVKNDELRQCRALIAPSVWWEPLGLVTYEAYDFSKPVLAASSGGFTETVIPGQTGLLHTPGDAESLTQDVLTLENLIPTERAVWGLNGRRWLLQNANVEAWKDRFEGILDGVRS
jgi:hypothetical protein